MSISVVTGSDRFFDLTEVPSLSSQEIREAQISLAEEIQDQSTFAGIIGTSSALRQVLRLVEMVASTDSTVLLLGETGTGKELIARAIHEESKRNKERFVTLNCAAIPEGLFESELFGHERGAFTGAQMQRIGRLELADRGTLFLDEIGDMPLELQAKLLRTLQERVYERVGSSRSKKVDMRLVAATNSDLHEMMAAKQFRPDLYYRLNVFPLRVPPLRERREDIPLLVQHFSRKFARTMGKQIDNIPAATMRKLMRWDWPGNVRELENLIERSVILTTGKTLMVAFTERMDAAIDTTEVIGAFDEQSRIVNILRETKGRISGPNGAALRLGVKRSTLLDRMKKLGINPREAKVKYAVAVA
jgi:formate hydrogenlyase transcriptional activator